MDSQHADIRTAAAAAIVAKNTTKLLTGIDTGAAIPKTTGTDAVTSN